MNVKELIAACQAAKIKGYSGLKKAELEILLATRVKPTPENGSTRAYKEQASALKKAGLIKGAISTCRVDELKTLVNMGGGTVAKKAITEKTIPWYKDALAPMRERVNAYAKERFGRTISACRKAELVHLYERFVTLANAA